jgi:hypothetical protein
VVAGGAASLSASQWVITRSGVSPRDRTVCISWDRVRLSNATGTGTPQDLQTPRADDARPPGAINARTAAQQRSRSARENRG